MSNMLNRIIYLLCFSVFVFYLLYFIFSGHSLHVFSKILFEQLINGVSSSDNNVSVATDWNELEDYKLFEILTSMSVFAG